MKKIIRETLKKEKLIDYAYEEYFELVQNRIEELLYDRYINGN